MSTGGIATRIAQLRLEHLVRGSGPIQASRNKDWQKKSEEDIGQQSVNESGCLVNEGARTADVVNKSPLTLRFEEFQRRKMQESKAPVPAPPTQVSGKMKPMKPLPPKKPPALSSIAKERLPPPLPRRLDITSSQLPARPTVSLKSSPTSMDHYCLYCRDFSAIDGHAAKFPRREITSLTHLSNDLTLPFHNITDKARAIFVWLHHNIIYNTDAFFSGNLKASTPESSLTSGLAVCEGYAGLFAELASLSGIEAQTISGFGKGFGFVPPGKEESVPKYEGNHAWNAVKLDDGQWHLIDACWGAGHVCSGNNKWVTKLHPQYFCSSAEEFGREHFPQHQDMQFRVSPRSWEEFIMAEESPMACSSSEFGINQNTLAPQQKLIYVGFQEFYIEPLCPIKAKCEARLLMIISPTGKRTPMTRLNGGWHCSIQVEEKGSWGCWEAIECSGENTWDPYRFGEQSLCVWVCE
jgi:hypothetical protein